MATLTVRGIDDETHTRLRVRAARHSRSVEAEVRAILHNLLITSEEGGLGSRIHARFAAVGGEGLRLPDRTGTPRPSEFHE